MLFAKSNISMKRLLCSARLVAARVLVITLTPWSASLDLNRLTLRIALK